MDGDANIAALAAVLADPARCRVLAALGDGRALPASMLASDAGVAASTASEHLARLVKAGLLTVERHGRHRYFRLAGPHVSDLLEALARVAPPAPVRSLREGTRAQALRLARTCYDHLAGRVGVAVMDSLLERGLIEADRLTPQGVAFLKAFGVDLDALPARRPAVRSCVDWSEQRPHLAGAVGAALASRLLVLGWIRRAERSRAVHVTDEGRTGFADVFGVDAGRRAQPADPEVVELQQRGRAPPDEGGQSPPKGSGA
jgi:DNA-binding transcriptional ArsR family regulator